MDPFMEGKNNISTEKWILGENILYGDQMVYFQGKNEDSVSCYVWHLHLFFIEWYHMSNLIYLFSVKDKIWSREWII